MEKENQVWTTGDPIRVYCQEGLAEAVQIAFANLCRDLKAILGCQVIRAEQPKQAELVVGDLACCLQEEPGLRLQRLRQEESTGGESSVGEVWKREGFLVQVASGRLYLTGTDRRGMIYAIYEFCEWMGVSPWYFFADVPMERKKELILPEGFWRSDSPSVEYRGIFINDEEELDHWVSKHMGEPTIGPKTYEKVFELLLRLKLNYIWPAMHVNSFNQNPENGALAERMGIVVGTSHCDMLMRSNNREWRPWLAKKGYQDVRYDYSISGRNREILQEYWRESVEQNRTYEVSYTVGMRGIHDSGFDASAMEGLQGEELLEAKKQLLQQVMRDQLTLLDQVIGHPVCKIFVPYKEVLELYDRGLSVPEDITLIWVNDNYGYIRRYPNEEEQKRPGGNGIYYHNSYWAPPGRSYLFIGSIPLAHTANELKKAWDNGIRKLWVLNVGAIKPLELELSFYAHLAWGVGKEPSAAENMEEWTRDWVGRTFGLRDSKDCGVLAGLLNRFSQLTNARKLELMEDDVFSQTTCGDEAADRLHQYEEMLQEAEHFYEKLPRERRDSFFQLVFMKLQAAYTTYGMYYYADRSRLLNRRGCPQAAAAAVRRSREMDEARQRLLWYYGNRMSGGKWSGILTPEDFPPPRTAMYPAAQPPLTQGKPGVQVTLWNAGKELCFVRPGVKWLELANCGPGVLSWRLEAPGWVSLSETSGSLRTEKRILVEVKEPQKQKNDGIRLYWRQAPFKEDSTEHFGEAWVPLLYRCAEVSCLYLEDDGRIVIEASELYKATLASENSPLPTLGRKHLHALGGKSFSALGWKLIPALGRGRGDLLQAERSGELPQELSAEWYQFQTAPVQLQVHRFPSLNSVGRIRVGISIDGGEPLLVESNSNDEWKGSWEENTKNSVDRLLLPLGTLAKGTHRISLYAMDPYFAFSRLVLIVGEELFSQLGYPAERQELPREWNLEEWTRNIYGEVVLPPRKEIYAQPVPNADCIINDDYEVQPGAFARRLTEQQRKQLLEQQAAEPFQERRVVGTKLTEAEAIRIEAAAVLEQTPFAYTRNGTWQYCQSQGYHGTGLAMYLEEKRRCYPSAQEAPALCYRLRTAAGGYRIWIHCKLDNAFQAEVSVCLDGKIASKQELYGGYNIWRFSAEQAWRWVPLWEVKLEEGEHLFSFSQLHSGMRVDRFYLTRGEERPPLDCEW